MHCILYNSIYAVYCTILYTIYYTILYTVLNAKVYHVYYTIVYTVYYIIVYSVYYTLYSIHGIVYFFTHDLHPVTPTGFYIFSNYHIYCV